MATFEVPTRDQVSEKSQQIFDNLKKQFGNVPNLYATIGYSGEALETYLNFSHALENSSFNQKEIQAIYLATSQVNDCFYCLSVHTLLATKAGFSEEETFELRTATVEAPKLKAITQLAKALVENRGRADEQYIEQFFAAGYDKAAFIDLVGLVTVKLFSNFVHNATKIPVDFPKAKSLAEITA